MLSAHRVLHQTQLGILGRPNIKDEVAQSLHYSQLNWAFPGYCPLELSILDAIQVDDPSSGAGQSDFDEACPIYSTLRGGPRVAFH